MGIYHILRKATGDTSFEYAQFLPLFPSSSSSSLELGKTGALTIYEKGADSLDSFSIVNAKHTVSSYLESLHGSGVDQSGVLDVNKEYNSTLSATVSSGTSAKYHSVKYGHYIPSLSMPYHSYYILSEETYEQLENDWSPNPKARPSSNWRGSNVCEVLQQYVTPVSCKNFIAFFAPNFICICHFFKANPSGCLIKLIIRSTWGDPYYVVNINMYNTVTDKMFSLIL
jgi:hypothetical protein